MTRAIETGGILKEHLKHVPLNPGDPLLSEGCPALPEPSFPSYPDPVDLHLDAPRIEASFRKYVHRSPPLKASAPKAENTDEYEIFAIHGEPVSVSVFSFCLAYTYNMYEKDSLTCHTLVLFCVLLKKETSFDFLCVEPCNCHLNAGFVLLHTTVALRILLSNLMGTVVYMGLVTSGISMKSRTIKSR
jgi:hypothetical protein